MNIYVSVGWCRKNVTISLILLLFRAGERKNPFLIAENQVRPSVLQYLGRCMRSLGGRCRGGYQSVTETSFSSGSRPTSSIQRNFFKSFSEKHLRMRLNISTKCYYNTVGINYFILYYIRRYFYIQNIGKITLQNVVLIFDDYSGHGSVKNLAMKRIRKRVSLNVVLILGDRTDIFVATWSLKLN
jgi:hypothetical protein